MQTVCARAMSYVAMSTCVLREGDVDVCLREGRGDRELNPCFFTFFPRNVHVWHRVPKCTLRGMVLVSTSTENSAAVFSTERPFFCPFGHGQKRGKPMDRPLRRVDTLWTKVPHKRNLLNLLVTLNGDETGSLADLGRADFLREGDVVRSHVDVCVARG